MIPTSFVFLLTVLAIPAEPPPREQVASTPTRYELPFVVRRDLPELKLTLWHFAADSKQRWAKINGQRVAEGDTLENGVRVLLVQADGVVCEFQGSRFRLDGR